MKRFRATKSIRLLLAAIALAGSVGSSPLIGHAHGPPPATPPPHHGWADHDHEHPVPHGDEADDHDGYARIGDSIFHLHGAWFGIPFSLGVPTPSAGGQGERVGQYAAADACLIRAHATGVAHLRGEPPLGTPASWLLYPLCAPSGQPSRPTSHPSRGPTTPGVLLMRSVALRC